MYNQDYLVHYGVIGMRWGRRRVSQYESASEKLKSGKAHASIGFGKKRQAAYDARDAKIFSSRAEIVKSKIANEETKDLSKFKKAGEKSVKTAENALNYRKQHTYDTDGSIPNIKQVYMDDPRLVAKAEKASSKVDRLMKYLNKKYDGKVSAILQKDLDTGKQYMELMLGSKSDRIDVNLD